MIYLKSHNNIKKNCSTRFLEKVIRKRIQNVSDYWIFLPDLDCENLGECYLDCNDARCACDYIRAKDIVCKKNASIFNYNAKQLWLRDRRFSRIQQKQRVEALTGNFFK